MKKRLVKIASFVIIIILFIMTPMFQVVKSYTIMSIYSHIHKVDSFLEDEEIQVKMRGGLATLKRDYYPFVMYYDTSLEYSKAKNEPIDLVVLYNFGYMKWLKGGSVLYDIESPYYSSFYGMYIASVKDKSRQFGLTSDQTIDIEEIMGVTDFDLKELVLDSIGLETATLEYNLKSTEETELRHVTIDGLQFQVIDANLYMNGMHHEYKKDYMAYIQYGRPYNTASIIESFPLIEAYGRIYIYFDTDKKVSYFAYIIGTDEQTLEETEKEFILTTKINL